MYRKYIDGLKDAKEESTIINIVFQRALADHPLQYDLWREYITFMVSNVHNYTLDQSVGDLRRRTTE